MELKDKNTIVVGAGKSGVAAARFMASRGAKVLLNDLSDIEHLGYLNREGIELSGMGHHPDQFRDKELIVLSPGVPAHLPPMSELIKEAEERGARVISEIELASRYTKTPLIAVTGTNGKSTTTCLIAEILENGGKKVFAGGNLGIPFTEYLLEGDNADIIILELSSFQLERIVGFCPFISIMLNISPDHLDRYSSMDDYINAKKRVFMNQGKSDFALLNMEDEIVAGFSQDISSTLVPFGGNQRHEGGVYLDKGFIISEINNYEMKIALPATGSGNFHIIENLMAAAAAALICGMSGDVIAAAIKNFNALKHRMEFVGEFQGVLFYNDSKATNVGALVRSLEGIEGRVVLIAGGKDKCGSYGPLKRIVKDKVKAAVLIGEAADRLGQAIGNEAETVMASSMEEAVEKAWQLASTGDVVLLSPACSSFDMFSGYSERGEVFINAVKRIISGKMAISKEVRFAS